MRAAARRSVVPADDPPTTEDAAALQGGGSTSGFRQQLNAYIRLIFYLICPAFRPMSDDKNTLFWATN